MKKILILIFTLMVVLVNCSKQKTPEINKEKNNITKENTPCENDYQITEITDNGMGGYTIFFCRPKNTEVTRLKLFVDDIHQWSWNPPVNDRFYNIFWDSTSFNDGDYEIKIKFLDSNNSIVAEETDLIFVDNNSDKEDPEIEIINPKDNSVIGDNISIKVNASDDKQLTRVQFLINNTMKCDTITTAKSGTYECFWDVDNYPEDDYVIKVIAKDYAELEENKKSTSSFINVKVMRAPDIKINHSNNNISSDDTINNFEVEIIPSEFGPIQPDEISLNIKNEGTRKLNISSIALTGGTNFTITQNPASAIAAGSSSILKVKMAASAVGTYTDTITINSDDPDEGTFVINLSGKAVIKPFIKKTLATGNYGNTYSHYFADVDGDGKKDLIQISKQSAKGWIGLAKEDGTYEIWTHTFPTGENSGSYKIYFANVNGTDADGKVRTDIIQVSTTQAKGWIGLAQPDGSFQIWTHTFPTGEYNGTYKLYFPDINGDGRADLVQVQKKGVKGWVGLAQPNGNFKIWTSTFATGENNGTYTHRFAKVNDDNCDDLIQFSTGAAKGWVGVSNCTNNFQIWTNNFPTGLNNGTYKMHFGDVNGDEKADLVQFSIGAAKGWLGLSNSSDNFDIWTNTIPTGENNGTYNQLLANVNGVDSDGKIRKDLIQVDTTGKIWVSISKGEGNLNIWDHTDQGQEGRYFAADINGDGKSDLISIGYNSSITLISNPLYDWNN